MGSLILIFSFLVFSQANAQDADLLGCWRFTSDRYQGQESPIPNPDLNLTFEFHEDGIDFLSWSRTGDPGHCQRIAQYKTEGGVLYQTVTSVDPNNSSDCASDPDMQVGATSANAYRVVNGRFELDLPLGDEVMTYIWTRPDDIDPNEGIQPGG